MKAVIACAALLALAVPAMPAFAMPPDCSKAPVPADPVRGEIARKPFVPTQATLRISQTDYTNGVSYDDHMLKLSKPEGDLDEAEMDITVMVKKGQRPDGRTFRKIPGGMDAQPQASQGMPEVQGWSMKDDATDARLDSVMSEKSSLQLTFGQRKGNTITGTVYICEPEQGSGWVAGTFSATIEK